MHKNTSWMTCWSGLNLMEKPGTEKHVFVHENYGKAGALTLPNTPILQKQTNNKILVILGRILNREGQNQI